MKCATPVDVKKAVKGHESKMHKKPEKYAKGGMVCGGMGAAQRGGKFVKNG
jgi:hypothetical protein